MSDIFISYSSEDRPKAELLAGVLEAQGWPAFWDRTIPPGKTFDEVIDAALKAAKCVIVLWSRASVQSNWVKEEADYGSTRHILVPALIEKVELPLGFRRVQAADLTDWSGEASHPELDRLLKSVEAFVGPAARVAPEIPRESSDVVADGPAAPPDSEVVPKPPASKQEIAPPGREAKDSPSREDAFGWVLRPLGFLWQKPVLRYGLLLVLVSALVIGSFYFRPKPPPVEESIAEKSTAPQEETVIDPEAGLTWTQGDNGGGHRLALSRSILRESYARRPFGLAIADDRRVGGTLRSSKLRRTKDPKAVPSDWTVGLECYEGRLGFRLVFQFRLRHPRPRPPRLLLRLSGPVRASFRRLMWGIWFFDHVGENVRLKPFSHISCPTHVYLDSRLPNDLISNI